MTNPQALREALEQIKANCFRSDITDHTALAGIAIIAKEALASTTVATAVIQGDARGIVEACAKIVDGIARHCGDDLRRLKGAGDDLPAETLAHGGQIECLRAAKAIRAFADAMLAERMRDKP